MKQDDRPWCRLPCTLGGAEQQPRPPATDSEELALPSHTTEEGAQGRGLPQFTARLILWGRSPF